MQCTYLLCLSRSPHRLTCPSEVLQSPVRHALHAIPNPHYRYTGFPPRPLVMQMAMDLAGSLERIQTHCLIVEQHQTLYLSAHFLKIASSNHDHPSAPERFLVCIELSGAYKRFIRRAPCILEPVASCPMSTLLSKGHEMVSRHAIGEQSRI